MVTKSIKGDIKVGATQYSDIVTTEFMLQKIDNTDKMLSEIDEIVYQEGFSTKTGHALADAFDKIRNASFGARSDTAKVRVRNFFMIIPF